MNRELIQRITNYLAAGGLVNPELMDHEKVRYLLIDCRDELAKPDIGIADPCPQCRRGGVCRTPTCRRLQLPVDHPYRNQAFAYSQPEQEQEPVAWLHPDKKVDAVVPTSLAWFDKPIPLYTAPPRKPWVGLTDEQIQLMAHKDDKGDWSDLRFRSCWHNGYVDGVNAANEKLKELNT